jgi:hypothetical protein
MLGICLGSWCLTPLLTIIQLYRGGQFLLLEETEIREKTINLPQVTEKLDHIMLHPTHLAISGIRNHNVSGDMH